MPRPNRDRVMVSFYIGRKQRTDLLELAAERDETQSDTVRAMLAYAQQRMPRGWQPKEKKPR